MEPGQTSLSMASSFITNSLRYKFVFAVTIHGEAGPLRLVYQWLLHSLRTHCAINSYLQLQSTVELVQTSQSMASSFKPYRPVFPSLTWDANRSGYSKTPRQTRDPPNASQLTVYREGAQHTPTAPRRRA